MTAWGRRGGAGCDGAGAIGYAFCVPIVVVFAASALTAATGRSFGAGMQATLWTVLLTSLAFYAVAMVEAVRWYRLDASLILAGDGVPVDAVGENLRNFERRTRNEARGLGDEVNVRSTAPQRAAGVVPPVPEGLVHHRVVLARVMLAHARTVTVRSDG